MCATASFGQPTVHYASSCNGSARQDPHNVWFPSRQPPWLARWKRCRRSLLRLLRSGSTDRRSPPAAYKFQHAATSSAAAAASKWRAERKTQFEQRRHETPAGGGENKSSGKERAAACGGLPSGGADLRRPSQVQGQCADGCRRRSLSTPASTTCEPRSKLDPLEAEMHRETNLQSSLEVDVLFSMGMVIKNSK